MYSFAVVFVCWIVIPYTDGLFDRSIHDLCFNTYQNTTVRTRH